MAIRSGGSSIFGRNNEPGATNIKGGTGGGWKPTFETPEAAGDRRVSLNSSEVVDLGERRVDEQIKKQEDYLRDWESSEQGRIQELDRADIDYMDQRRGAYEDESADLRSDELQYQKALNDARNVSRQNMEDATSTYKELSPMHREAMNRARDQAGSAMTLEEYMDPNNKVQSAYRNLYNTEGANLKSRYETEAQAAQKRGQADFGILSSLGAQAAAGANVGPMTVGQQMANMAVANQQAGEAYANTQRRMQALRDYGMQGEDALRSQGLAAGERAGDKAYEAGRLAQEDLARRMAETEGFDRRYRDDRTGISDRLTGIEGDRLASEGRMREQTFGGLRDLQDLGYSQKYGQVGRQGDLSRSMLGANIGMSDKRLGRADVKTQRQLGILGQKAAASAAEDERKRAMIGGALQGLGTVGGAVAGGFATGGNPMGVMMGAQLGGGIGGSLSGAAGGTPQPAPNYYSGGYQSFNQPQQPTVAPQPSPYMPPATPGGYNYGNQPYGGYNYPVRPTTMPS